MLRKCEANRVILGSGHDSLVGCIRVLCGLGRGIKGYGWEVAVLLVWTAHVLASISYLYDTV